MKRYSFSFETSFPMTHSMDESLHPGLRICQRSTGDETPAVLTLKTYMISLTWRIVKHSVFAPKAIFFIFVSQQRFAQ